MPVFKVHTNGRSWLIQMPGELITHFILCSTGTNKCLLSQAVAGDVEDLRGICALEKEKVGGEGERGISKSCVIERNDLIGSVFYRFHSPNYIDFPLQSAPFLFPFPHISAFISFLNFCFYSLLTVTLMSMHPLGGFSLFAWIRYCILGVICQFVFTIGIGFSH